MLWLCSALLSFAMMLCYGCTLRDLLFFGKQWLVILCHSKPGTPNYTTPRNKVCYVRWCWRKPSTPLWSLWPKGSGTTFIFGLLQHNYFYSYVPSPTEVKSHIIFPNAQMTSNKMVHKKRHHFLAQFSIPFHMVWSVLLQVLAQKTTFWVVEILWEPIRSFFLIVFEASTRDKTKHTMW